MIKLGKFYYEKKDYENYNKYFEMALTSNITSPIRICLLAKYNLLNTIVNNSNGGKTNKIFKI